MKDSIQQAGPGRPGRPGRWRWLKFLPVLVLASLAMVAVGQNRRVLPPDPFVTAVKELRPSIVAVGSYLRTDTPTVQYFGTGFVVEDGNLVVTNAHVVAALRAADRLDHLRVFFPDTVRDVDGKEAKVLLEDTYHDVALLRFEGRAGGVVKLAPTEDPDQGLSVGIMGYPTGTRLGLVPAVHQGVLAAVVPAVLPLPTGVKLTPELREALKNPYNLYQLDMVAFPGNSGSPLFDARTGEVIGVLNMTLATKTREHLFDKPTGIAYAVPVRWVHELIRKNRAINGSSR
ncbi:MAG: serine protease [Phycisphaeraceae bacterium]